MTLMLAAASSQSTTPAWLTLAVAVLAPLAALAGVLATFRLETKKQRASKERDAELKTEERALRAADYQQQTLHDLQEALQGFLLAALRRARPDHEAEAITDVLNYVDTSGRVVMLMARLEDVPARDAVGKALEAIVKMDEARATGDTIRPAQMAVTNAQRAMGDALRALP